MCVGAGKLRLCNEGWCLILPFTACRLLHIVDSPSVVRTSTNQSVTMQKMTKGANKRILLAIYVLQYFAATLKQHP